MFSSIFKLFLGSVVALQRFWAFRNKCCKYLIVLAQTIAKKNRIEIETSLTKHVKLAVFRMTEEEMDSRTASRDGLTHSFVTAF